MSKPLSTDEIDKVVTDLVLSGPHGAEVAVTCARVAGRAIRLIYDAIGPQAAVVAAEEILKNTKAGRLN